MPLYFIAIITPADINTRVLVYKHYMLHQYGCKVALKSPAHVTLVAPFTMEESETGRLEAALMDFAAGVGDFTIALTDFAAFPPRVIYIDVQQSQPLQQVQKALEDRLFSLAFPVKRSAQQFHPHVTIANRDLGPQSFHQAWNHFKDEKFEAVFEASGVSVLKHTGSYWETMYTTSFT